MHCWPWNLMIGSGESTDIVTSFAGAEDEAAGQGGYMMWGNQGTDWDATIFQHKNVLLCQIRGFTQDWDEKWFPDGYPEAPGVSGSLFLGYKGPRKLLHSRIYIAHTIGELHFEDGWIFGAKAGVYFAIRSVRGGFREEDVSDWGLGKVFVCEVWDDVVLLEAGEAREFGSFEAFRERILACRLQSDEQTVRYTSAEGDELLFCWRADGLPSVNDATPDYGKMRIDDPCVKSVLGSGIIEIRCGEKETTLDASDPDNIRRVESPPCEV